MTTEFSDLSKSKQATLWAIRSYQVHSGTDPKAAHIIKEVESMPDVRVSPSTVHASLSDLVDAGVLQRVDDDTDGRVSRYQFVDDGLADVLEEIVVTRARQVGLTVRRGEC